MGRSFPVSVQTKLPKPNKREIPSMCTLILNGLEVIVAFTGDVTGFDNAPSRIPFSAPMKKRRARNTKLSAAQIQKQLEAEHKRQLALDARMDKMVEVTPMVGSAKRRKTAIAGNNKDARVNRNTTKRTLSRGKVVIICGSYTYRTMGGIFTGTLAMREGRVRKYSYHDSHGRCGRKPKKYDIDRTSIRKFCFL